jgi:hypothetical protein
MLPVVCYFSDILQSAMFEIHQLKNELRELKTKIESPMSYDYFIKYYEQGGIVGIELVLI